MPVLDDVRDTEEIVLPKTKAKIKLWKEFLAGDFLVLAENYQEGEKAPVGLVIKMLNRFIADWDFTDKENNKLPVTKENLEKLPFSDLEVLIEKFTNVSKISTISNEQKKNISR